VGAHAHQLKQPAAIAQTPAWLVRLFELAAALLVPWVVLLVTVLPSAHRAHHWNVVWAGFDAALAILLVTVAVTAARRSPNLQGAAGAAAALLFVDAWFDVLTSSTRAELIVALVEAVFVEIPFAVLCLRLAHPGASRTARHGRSDRDSDRGRVTNLLSPVFTNRT